MVACTPSFVIPGARFPSIKLVSPGCDSPTAGRTKDLGLTPQSSDRPNHAIAASGTSNLDLGSLLEAIVGHCLCSSTSGGRSIRGQYWVDALQQKGFGEDHGLAERAHDHLAFPRRRAKG